MGFSEKADMEAARAAGINIHNEYDMLRVNINRIFVTDDILEVKLMYDAAKKCINGIYEYHLARVQELQSLKGGGVL